TVTGRVVNADSTAVAGATIEVTGGATLTSDSNGAFSADRISTVPKRIEGVALLQAPGSPLLVGCSASVHPIRGGVTDLGTIVIQSDFDCRQKNAYISDTVGVSVFERSTGRLTKALEFGQPFFGRSTLLSPDGSTLYLSYIDFDASLNTLEVV